LDHGAAADNIRPVFEAKHKHPGGNP
jgi:hypothetical protein